MLKYNFLIFSVTLGFFDDILIPPESLQHPSRFDETEQVWIWKFTSEGVEQDFFMDPGKYGYLLNIKVDMFLV